jgi:hypothetical protein
MFANDLDHFRKMLLAPMLCVSLALNLWGTTVVWHPDEITERAMAMFDSRTLNHHNFAYGPLHYYQVILFAVLPAKALNKILVLDSTTLEAIAIVLSRAVSASLGTGVVLSIYLLAKELFNSRAALFSSLLLTTCMGFVYLSHFATADMAWIFWSSFSCLMSAHAFSDKSRKWYIFAGLFAGLAAAVKITGGVALVTLVLAHILSKQRKHAANLVIGVLVALIGFLAALPVLIFAFFEFAEGFIKDMFYASARDANGPHAFLPLVSELRNALGIALFLLCIGSILYSLNLFASKELRGKVLLVWSMIFPYYVLMGSMHASRLRYAVPMIPGLLILTGKMVSDFTSSRMKLPRVVSIVLLGIVLSYSLIYTIALNLEFTNDSRYLVAMWVSKNVEEQSKIEVAFDGPPLLPIDRYTVIKHPMVTEPQVTTPLLRNNSAYLTLLAMISKLKTVAGSRERPYIAWWERDKGTEASQFDLTIKGLENRKPDYFVVNVNDASHFLNDKDSVEGQFFSSLSSGQTSYKKIAEFKYRFLSWIDPEVSFVNPMIHVYRADSLSHSVIE